MTARQEKGRRSENKQYEKNTHFRDTLPPESAEMGMLIKQDEMILALNAAATAMNALTLALDTAIGAATDGNTLYTELSGITPLLTTLTASIEKVKLM